MFKSSIKKFSELRRGFFCFLCDANNQKMVPDFYNTTNLLAYKQIYYSKEFCKRLVDDTITASFYQVYDMKRFLDATSVLVNCKRGRDSEYDITYEISLEQQDAVKNCYYFRNKFFFQFCQKYCTLFNITKASPVLEGDL